MKVERMEFEPATSWLRVQLPKHYSTLLHCISSICSNYLLSVWEMFCFMLFLFGYLWVWLVSCSECWPLHYCNAYVRFWTK